MPRIYGDYVMIAALDDDLGQVAGDLVKKADDLDVSIGEAAQNFDKRACERLKLLRSQCLSEEYLNHMNHL